MFRGFQRCSEVFRGFYRVSEVFQSAIFLSESRSLLPLIVLPLKTPATSVQKRDAQHMLCNTIFCRARKRHINFEHINFLKVGTTLGQPAG